MNHYATLGRGNINKSWQWEENKRYRQYFFTKNNYTDADYNYFLEAVNENRKPKATYVAVSKEVGPANGVPHLHAVVYFKDCQYPRVIRNKFRDMFSEPCYAKSTNKQHLDYIQKENPAEERGTRPNENPNHGRHAGGETTKQLWQETKDLARQGRLEEIEASHYVCQYGNLKRIAMDNRPKPAPLPLGARKRDFEWWYGDAGTGKSNTSWKQLCDEYGEENVFDKPPTNKWIDASYPADAPWRINDVDKYASKHMACEFKVWAEEAPFRGEDKGLNIWARPSKIIVTSNYAPWDIWGDSQTLDAICSRYKIVYWPRRYDPEMPKPDPRVDKIHPPWDYTPPVLRTPAPRQEEPVPPPVLRRTDSIFANSIWDVPLELPISEEENRENIQRWLGDFQSELNL